MRWRLGLRPIPRWGSLRHSSDPLVGRGFASSALALPFSFGGGGNNPTLVGLASPLLTKAKCRKGSELLDINPRERRESEGRPVGGREGEGDKRKNPLATNSKDETDTTRKQRSRQQSHCIALGQGGVHVDLGDRQ